jgi:uncharacterized glyoxalase superfamily protein PhnB
VEIFFNDRSTVAKENPQFSSLSVGGGGNTMFIEVQEDIDTLYDRIKPHAPVVMAIHTQWYGMREFAITDQDGYVITFAQKVENA